MPKKKKKKKKFPFFLVFLFLFAGAMFLYLKEKSDYTDECGLLESRINSILFEQKIPEDKIATIRIEEKRNLKKWIYITKKIKSPLRKIKAIKKAIENYGYSTEHKKNEITVFISNLPVMKLEFEKEVKKPLLAIVIDDCGGSKTKVRQFIETGLLLNFSILPMHRYSTFLANALSDSGFEVLLHQPMQPHKQDAYALGKNALLPSMNEKEIKKILEENLKTVPTAKGANNHMGSLFTENYEKMKIVLKFLKKKNLYFLDSRTSSKSVAKKCAEEVKIPFAQNDIFIDNTSDVSQIKNQIEKGIRLAKKRGYAVIIGHATRKQTAQALYEMRNKLNECRLVKVSELIAERRKK